MTAHAHALLRADARWLPAADWSGFRSALRSFAGPSRPAAAPAAPVPARERAAAVPRTEDAHAGPWRLGLGTAAILAVKLAMLWIALKPV